MDKNHILIVEDDADIRSGIEIYLKNQGYDVSQAGDGIEGLAVIEKEEIDLAIVDIMMPRMDGITMMMKVREKGYDFPVIMLSAKSEEVDKIMGLNMGADDYITKPFSMRELMARVKANIRRRDLDYGVRPKGELLKAGSLAVDPASFTVTKNGAPVELTQKEFDLLLYLLRERGRVFTREDLMQKVWNYDYFGDMRTVDVTVRRLREKIEDDPGKPAFIMTKRGVGYYFAP